MAESSRISATSSASGFDDDISEYVEREAERDARVAQGNRVSAPVAEVEEDPYA